MAVCKICGYLDETLPDWDNWDCNQCVREEIEGIDGTFTPTEKMVGDVLGKREIR